MFVDLLVYLIVFTISCASVCVFQRAYCKGKPQDVLERTGSSQDLTYCVFGILSLFPIIAMTGLRYGIGADYSGYESIYNAVHSASFSEYWRLHNTLGNGSFYVEPGYYLFNRISPSYRVLLWLDGILLFLLFLLAIKDYVSRISFGLALFILLSTELFYSLNAVRFVLALGFLLVGYVALANHKTVWFIGMVLLASLFHVSIIPCLLLAFLKPFRDKRIENIRDAVFFVMIVIFPFIIGALLKAVSSFPLFERYFSVGIYTVAVTPKESIKWMLHIVPVVLPVLLFCRKEIFDSGDTRTFFRICLLEIPFRSLGLYNTWYARYARCAQIVQVIFIPLVLSKVTNKRTKTILVAYYIAWYVFYCGYYAILVDKGTSLPYTWIFS